MTDQESTPAPTLEHVIAERNLLELHVRTLERDQAAALSSLERVVAILVRNSSRRTKREILAAIDHQEDAERG
jgi:hypothetical protein